MQRDVVSILDGATFVISDRRGDIDATPASPHGLFHADMRYLSRFRLTVNGVSPVVLSIDDASHDAAQFFLVQPTGSVILVQPTGSVIDDAQLSVIRRRSIDLGFREEIAVLNHSLQAVRLELRIEVGADFTDLFEVKEQLEKAGDHYRDVREDGLVLGYRRGTYRCETALTT
ncbi:MAG: glycogen debranching N-terminal domain-containing protein, partial [Acidimicrobiales bacterium]